MIGNTLCNGRLANEEWKSALVGGRVGRGAIAADAIKCEASL